MNDEVEKEQHESVETSDEGAATSESALSAAEEAPTAKLGSGGSRTQKVPHNRPTTQNRPVHADATARLFIDGLSVVCADRRHENVQIGFVAHEHSPVQIRVFRAGSCRIVDEFTCPRGRQVRIEVSKTTYQTVGEFFENASIYREDHLWMPDLQEWHSSSVTLRDHAEAHLSALLVVTDATFYTHVRSVNPAILEHVGGTRSQVLPTAGRILGANIRCGRTDSGVSVKVIGRGADGRPELLWEADLPKNGPQFTVTLRSTAESNGDHLEMVYRHIIDPGDGTRFSLKYSEPEHDWIYCGFIANMQTREYFANGTEEAANILDDRRQSFNTAEAAEELGYTAGREYLKKSVEYACQSTGGGSGPFENIP